MRWPRWVAIGLSLLGLVMVAGSGWLLIACRTGPHTLRNFIGLGAVAAATAVLGLVVSLRVPRNVVGALLTWVGVTALFLASRDVYFSAVVSDPGRLPLDSRVVAWFDESGWWLFVAVGLLLLYFPDGRLASPRWRVLPPA